jgi:SAM-dependent methyltransferase
MDANGLSIQDSTGISISRPSADAQKADKWIYEKIRPYIKGKILEIASGIGNLASLFVQDGLQLRVSDLHGKQCRMLQKTFEGVSAIKAVHRIDPRNPKFDALYARYLRKFDTVLLINNIDVNPEEPLVLNNLKELVKENGHIILQIPAHTAVYNDSEDGLSYWRHRNRHVLKKQLGKEFGLLDAWFYNASKHPGTSLGHIPSLQLDEENHYYRSGLSVIMAGKRK